MMPFRLRDFFYKQARVIIPSNNLMSIEKLKI